MLIYGKSDIKILYDISRYTPSELFVNGENYPINQSISSTTYEYYNITIKWNYYLISDCSYMFYSITSI